MLVGILLCTACAAGNADRAEGVNMEGARSIAGTASYREGMMLPADAVFEVTLEDARVRGLGSIRLRTAGITEKEIFAIDPAIKADETVAGSQSSNHFLRAGNRLGTELSRLVERWRRIARIGRHVNSATSSG